MIAAAVAVLLGMASFARADDPPLRVGFGAADITPDLSKKPVFIAGYGKNRRATRVHDPIMARAVVLEHGGRRVGIVSVDLIGLFRDSVERARKELPEYEHLLVTSTHSHAGPDTLGLWGPNLFASGVDPDYLTQVETGIVKAVRKAEASLTPTSQTRLGSARNAELLHDSRLPIVKHDELTAFEFRNADGKSLGLVLAWNCHPEALGRDNVELSADFVGTVVKTLEESRKAPVVYLTGTVGGLMSPPDRFTDDAGQPLPRGGFAMMDKYGREVARLADAALANGRPGSLVPFRVQTRELYLPIDNDAYILGFRLGVLDRQAFGWSGSIDRPLPFDKNDPKQRLAARTEIVRLRLGDLDIAGIPGEIYPELVVGEFQNPADPAADFPNAPLESPILPMLDAPFRMIVGLANDQLGYIIPKRQWDATPPFAYGRKTSQYGEINSLGPETAPLLCNAFQEMIRKK